MHTPSIMHTPIEDLYIILQALFSPVIYLTFITQNLALIPLGNEIWYFWGHKAPPKTLNAGSELLMYCGGYAATIHSKLLETRHVS